MDRNAVQSLKTLARPAQDMLIYGLLISMSVLMLLPFLWMISTSLKPMSEVFGYPPTLITPNSSLTSYVELITDHGILRSLFNSFFIATASALAQLLLCSATGYGFAKFKFPGREALFSVVLGSLIIPFTVLMVPLYKIMRDLGWIDSFLAVIVPVAANAFGVFFLRQYITTINDELFDAARIDGASELRIFTQVVLPIIRPGLVSFGLILFMRSWNAYLWPLVVLRSKENFTMVLHIDTLVGPLGDATRLYNLQMAGGVISIIPLLIIFVVFQRRFVEGITAGAMK
jgi:ABC-type glycerol-3-phosphate transport system permease component